MDLPPVSVVVGLVVVVGVLMGSATLGVYQSYPSQAELHALSHPGHTVLPAGGVRP